MTVVGPRAAEASEWDPRTGDSAFWCLLGACVFSVLGANSSSCLRTWHQGKSMDGVLGEFASLGDTFMGRWEGVLGEWHRCSTLDGDLCRVRCHCCVPSLAKRVPRCFSHRAVDE